MDRQKLPRVAAVEFESVVADILAANKFRVEPMAVSGRGAGFDFKASLAGKTWAVEVKFYRTPQSQFSLLRNAATQLTFGAIKNNITQAMLVVSCSLDPETRYQLEHQFGNIVFVDRVDLEIWSRHVPDILERLSILLGELSDAAEIGEAGRTIDDIVKLVSSEIDEELLSVPDDGAKLCKRLREVGLGKAHWRKYEELCAEILQYLFKSDLEGWHDQKRTDDGLNRFDLICRVRPRKDFWKFVVHDLKSRYVLFEFKNYTGKIKQGQVLTTERYLFSRGLRNVAIILCRKGPDKNAEKMMMGAMREHGRLMLALNDDQVCDLLHGKDEGNDPSDKLFELADDFMMKLSR